jgi:flagellar M-ring protein FliF
MLQSFRDIPAGRQLAIVAFAAALLCAALLGAYLMFLRPSYGILFSDLRTSDAATIVAELDKRKIAYKLEEGGTRIMVPADKVNETRLAVMSQDLPLKGQVGFELFNKSDMGLTEFAQKINYQRALQGELARTIMTMDAVDTARIHLSLSEHTIFRDDRVPPKASVTVVPRVGHRITAATVRAIQRLVAAAVPELEPGSVVVVDGGGRVVSTDAQPAADAGAVSPERRAVEQYYEAQVRQAIAGAGARGDAEVSVTALAAAGLAGAASPYKAWTPATRSFPLQVAVSLAATASQPVQDSIRTAAAAALQPVAGVSDTVSVTLADSAPEPQAWNEAIPAAPHRASAPETREAPAIGGFWLWGLGGVAALLLALRLFRGSASRPLSDGQRADYVSRFRALLDAEEANA